MKLVLFPPVEEPRLSLIRDAAGDMQVVNAEDAETARQHMADADAFFGKITPELLAAATRLKWVQSPTASLEHYLFPELIDHPCQLSNMRGIFFDVIADHVMSYVLCFARNLHSYLRQQQQRQWAPLGGEEARSNFTSGPATVSNIDLAHLHLPDCTLGVVGCGSIGREVCIRAAAFNMTVLGIDPVCRSIPGVVEDVWLPERLPDLLAQSDFVVIAAPHTPEQMKSSAYLINIGRGAIVDLADLTAALEQKGIAGAALDVFEIEPLPQDHPLWGMENVLITPHIAAASPRVAERHTQTLLENIRLFVRGEDPATLVDKRKWY